jgi:hypothetical protein
MWALLSGGPDTGNGNGKAPDDAELPAEEGTPPEVVLAQLHRRH